MARPANIIQPAVVPAPPAFTHLPVDLPSTEMPPSSPLSSAPPSTIAIECVVHGGNQGEVGDFREAMEIDNPPADIPLVSIMPATPQNSQEQGRALGSVPGPSRGLSIPATSVPIGERPAIQSRGRATSLNSNTELRRSQRIASGSSTPTPNAHQWSPSHPRSVTPNPRKRGRESGDEGEAKRARQT